MDLPGDLGLARIVAQRLVDPLPDPVAAVEHLCCVQGQDLRGAISSIALRTATGDPDQVVAAFDAGLLVRSWTMRGTLHVVLARDLGWILGLTAARMVSSAAGRRAQLGIDEPLLAAAEAVVRRVLDGGGRAGRGELLAAFDAAGLLQAVPQRGVHLLATLAMRGVVVQGPIARGASGGLEQQFVLAQEWVHGTEAPQDPVAHWAGRYATGHGPATLDDLVRWTGLTRTACRAGLASAPGLLQATDDGTTWWYGEDLPARLATRRAEAAGTFLLPGFDELVLGYADRSCTVAPRHASAIVPGNNGMFRATVVDAGRVVATWRRPTRPGAPRRVEWLEEPSAALRDRVSAVPMT